MIKFVKVDTPESSPHARVNVFDGPDGEHLGFCGELKVLKENAEELVGFKKAMERVDEFEGALELYSESLFRNAVTIPPEVASAWELLCATVGGKVRIVGGPGDVGRKTESEENLCTPSWGILNRRVRSKLTEGLAGRIVAEASDGYYNVKWDDGTYTYETRLCTLRPEEEEEVVLSPSGKLALLQSGVDDLERRMMGMTAGLSERMMKIEIKLNPVVEALRERHMLP